jgi:sugar-phosphatase
LNFSEATNGIKAIIFDMDGTLIDSTQTWIDADIELGIENGFEYTEEMFLTTKTLKFMKACEYLGQFCHMSAEETAKRYFEILSAKYGDSPLTPGVPEFLEKCRQAGIKMCVLTAGIQTLADSAIGKHGLSEYFEFIASADNIDLDKNDPAAFDFCAGKLGAKIAETLVIEDSYHAAEAAKKAGARVFSILNAGNKFEHEYLATTSDMTMNDFTEITRD